MIRKLKIICFFIFPLVLSTFVMETAASSKGEVKQSISNKANQESPGYAYYDFGVFAYEDDDYEGAEKNFKKAISLNPSEPSFYYYLGKTYLKTKRFKEAIDLFIKASAIDPDISNLKYDTAMTYYLLENFHKASALFIEIVQKEPSNILSHYYAGMSLFKQKEYKKAIDYFSYASKKSPSVSANSQFYIGVCYKEIGEIDKAIDSFNFAMEHTESKVIKEYAKKMLENANAEKKLLNPYTLNVKLSYRYDDNVRLEPINQDVYSNEGDFGLSAYISGRYKFINQKDFKLGIGLSYLQNFYNSLHSYNLSLSTAKIFTEYNINSLSFTLSYLPSYYLLATERYLMQHRIEPGLSWKINDQLLTKFTYSYSNNDYFTQHSLDGKTDDFFIDLYYFLAKQKIVFFGGIGYEDNDATSTDQYYKMMETRVGLSVDTIWELNLSLTGKYIGKDYDYKDSYNGIVREDTKYYAGISLSREMFYKWLNFSIEYNYTKNNSNLIEYKYDRNVAAFSVGINF